MARQSFRGAGGAGAVVLPYEHGGTGTEYEVTASSRHASAAEADRRLEGALAIVASGVLVVIGIFLAGWTFAG